MLSNVFVGHPVETVLLACTVVLWVATELFQALRRRSNAANDDRQSLLILRACITAGVLLAVMARRVAFTAFPEDSVALAAALVLLWLGVGLRWWSFRTLGRYFTFSVMTSTDQPVVTGGPYRLLRHPSYAALLLALCGVGLMLGNWLSVAALLLFPLAGLLYRIQVEESALSAAVGPAYTRYAATRKRIIPFVW